MKLPGDKPSAISRNRKSPDILSAFASGEALVLEAQRAAAGRSDMPKALQLYQAARVKFASSKSPRAPQYIAMVDKAIAFLEGYLEGLQAGKRGVLVAVEDVARRKL